MDNKSLDYVMMENRSLPVVDWDRLYTVLLNHTYPAIVIYRVVVIIWYVIGYISNAISIKIWSIPHMKRINASALYLVALTVADVTYLLLHILHYLWFWGINALVNVVCEVWSAAYMVPQYASQLLVLGFTVEQVIATHCPLRSARFWSQRTPKAITVICLIAVLISLPQCYIWTYDQEFKCVMKKDAAAFIFGWTIATEIVFFGLIPFVIFACNICILRASRKASEIRHLRQQSINGAGISMRNGHQNNCRQRSERSNWSSTVTLVCVSCFRISVQLPLTFVFLFNYAVTFGPPMPLEDMNQDLEWQKFFQYVSARIIVNGIGVSYHAVTFFIFCATTSQFRSEVQRLFKIKRCPCSGRERSTSIRTSDSDRRSTLITDVRPHLLSV